MLETKDILETIQMIRQENLGYTHHNHGHLAVRLRQRRCRATV